MKKNVIKGLLSIAMVTIMGLSMIGCGSKNIATSQDIDLNSMTLEEIIDKAKEEGKVNSAAMPDSWANWGETWDEIEKLYGIKQTDVDMSSAEEISLFESEGKNSTKDIGDVGMAFGPIAEAKGLTLKYKTSYWDELPDWAKDDDGDWVVGYYGTISILTNTTNVENAPKSFEDILNGDYIVSVGDVTKASQAQNAILATAIAFGGDEANLQPAYDFYKKLAEEGRLDKGELNISRLEKGEIDVALLWDFNALGYKEQITTNNPNMSFEVHIPEEASISAGYATIINTYAKNPYAAALTREYILSDEGQINLAKGFAKPIRESVELPEEVKAKMVDDSEYENTRTVQDVEAWEESTKNIASEWQENVLFYAK
ncbi:ABC transporter substrate-binding protein [Clostridium cuniculi]|uniref:ABC transporter substrate-binding protein n=1 Tax=Clostridium cuniculi TaxID=2548455 RepID=UPI00140FED5E|nr:ABC transporter substrate-binding protein [Clostridium cuniculi]MDO5793678.1 ABC transporter substrate-binding protein [Turicibacter sp.]